MISVDHVKLMSEYSHWMNQSMYASCAGLDDSTRREDRGAYFGSIHATLNHLLHGDQMFLSRFQGNSESFAPIGTELHSDFDELRRQRVATDQHIETWAAAVTDDWLRDSMTYTSLSDGNTRTVAHWVLVTHLFNHGTHHRGQVTTLLAQLGVDFGVTDIPFMPQFQAQRL